MQQLKTTVIIKPISENTIWQGRHVKTTAYRNWRDEIGWLLKKKHMETVKGWHAIEVEFYVENFKGTDASNLEKGFFDSLVDMQLIVDDKWTKWHRSEKFPIAKGEQERISFRIIPLAL